MQIWLWEGTKYRFWVDVTSGVSSPRPIRIAAVGMMCELIVEVLK